MLKNSIRAVSCSVFALLALQMNSCASRRFDADKEGHSSSFRKEGADAAKDVQYVLALRALQQSPNLKPRPGYFCFYHAKVKPAWLDRDRKTKDDVNEALRRAYDDKKIAALIPGRSPWSVLTFWKKSDHMPVSLDYIKKRLSIIEGEARMRHESDKRIAEIRRLSKQVHAKLMAFEVDFSASTTEEAGVVLAATLNGAFETWDGTTVRVGVNVHKIIENPNRVEQKSAEEAEAIATDVASEANDSGDLGVEGADLHEFKLLKQAVEASTDKLSEYNLACPSYKDFYNMGTFERQ